MIASDYYHQLVSPTVKPLMRESHRHISPAQIRRSPEKIKISDFRKRSKVSS
jgi:hypothetical protein